VTRRQRIEDLTGFAVPEGPALSPDGNRIAYVLRTAKDDRNERAIWLVENDEPRQLTRGSADTAPAWSPDGARLAFLRAADGPAQLWLLPAGGEPEQVTTLPLGAGTPHWSPDGTKIAFAAPVETGAGDEKAPIVTDRLDYQADGAGYLRTIRKHLHVLDVDTREIRQVTEGDWHAGEPDWSPDSTRLAYGAATAPDADLVTKAPAYVLDVTDPVATPRIAGLPDGIAARVTWLDDDTLLVVGMVDSPVGHARLLRLPVGGEPTDLTPALDRNVMPGGPAYPGATPRLGGDGILFCVRDRGCTHLYTVPVDGNGAARPLVAGAGRVVSGLSVAGDKAAILLATPTSFGEVVLVDLPTGAEKTVTTHTDVETEMYPREERQFTISDGTTVHGWFVRDPATTGPGPLLLDVHGGPHNAWNGAADEIHVYHQELAALGWTILLLNPRASDGYGEDFYTATVGGWGTLDAKDFLEPIEQLVADGVADPRRLAVAGYSYGGFMTCYLTSRDNRFAAAVAGGVVADLTSMAGTSDAGHELARYELGANPHTERDRYADMSPIAKVENVRTPTLVIQGAADVRCPVGQAQQWYTALREQGVATRLVLYPEGTHLFILDGPPSHRIDFNRRIVDWVEQYANDGRRRIDAAHWQRRLNVIAERHRVPGATLGILRFRPGREDELVEAAHGVLNVETGVETTTDSVFQIGSISKVWTTTVVMQLVDEGKLDLDAPIAEVLPDLKLSDPDVTKRVTMRHLLTHTSGIDGDVFTDTGRGDDCLERYVEALADVAQNHPLGATWSYCNAGFSVAGHVIEKLTGKTWDAAIRERLFTPLGLTHTGTLPEEALLFRAAVGHTGDKEPVKAPVWVLQRSAGPAGLIHATVKDVLAFARMHLAGGVAEDGTRVLSEESVAAMQSFQADVPDKYILGDSWGLGWFRLGWDGKRLIGHDGNTIGQSAFLRVFPDEGLAVTLLTNGGSTHDFFVELYGEIFAELAGITMPKPLSPPEEPVEADIAPHVGTYERASTRMEVLAGDDGPRMKATVTGPLAEVLPEKERVQEYPLVPIRENLYAVRQPGTRTWIPVTFYQLATGERYMHFGVRATPKVS
jgi:dipeptidyl aminopeptidase/acylaminoacyl peptidase/CubicO group peptidase (beta-lactamase class C family)